MNSKMTLKLGAWLLGLSVASAGTAYAQETNLDYGKLTGYLAAKYNGQCTDVSSSTRKAFRCILAGNAYRVPYVEVGASADDKSVSYSLTVRVGDRSDIASFDHFYQETIAAIDVAGTPMKTVAPTISDALNLCFANSELGKNDRVNCRYLPPGMGFWLSADNYYEFIVSAYTTK
ncbi:3',5'-cyclic adenosine monophosphate phosphodiesterase CpdA (plasmid) [Mesorhizobium loti]|nr:3',5'-cyclic adenosine monophosphate phosphodiesterase CpdA [Mesorhizobium loti]